MLCCSLWCCVALDGVGLSWAVSCCVVVLCVALDGIGLCRVVLDGVGLHLLACDSVEADPKVALIGYDLWHAVCIFLPLRTQSGYTMTKSWVARAKQGATSKGQHSGTLPACSLP